MHGKGVGGRGGWDLAVELPAGKAEKANMRFLHKWD
jgi:hypothetical protein